MAKYISWLTGIDFMDWLEEQGVIPKGRMLRRVIIDACFDGEVKIYTEEVCSARLVEGVMPPLMIDVPEMSTDIEEKRDG